MYCRQCGASNLDDARFCTACGAAMTAQAAPVETPPETPVDAGQKKKTPMPTWAVVCITLAIVLGAVIVIPAGVILSVPMFTSVGDVQQTAINANVRAIRSAAVTMILVSDSVSGTGPWQVEADISEDGEITNLTVVPEDDPVDVTPSDVAGHYKVAIYSLD